MIPVKQTKFTLPDQSVHGNCLAACLASLLEIPLSDVPTIEDAGKQWFEIMYEFLKARGYEYQGTGWPNVKMDWWRALTNTSPGVDGYYIVGGKSPRAHVTRGHAVIYKGGVMVHDPHPSNDGLLDIEDVMMIERKA